MASQDLRWWLDLGLQTSLCGVSEALAWTGGYLTAGAILNAVISSAQRLGGTVGSDIGTQFRQSHSYCELGQTRITSHCAKVASGNYRSV